MDGMLVLEDNTRFSGRLLTTDTIATGEVVFTTAMAGYQETITDPSFCGQIVTMTFPLIGNCGINDSDSESETPAIAGLIVRQACTEPNHWQSTSTLISFLEHHRIPALEGVDTRALTRHLRDQGTMAGAIMPSHMSVPPAAITTGLVDRVSTPDPYHIPGSGPHIAVLDLGVKQGIISHLQRTNCRITVMPYQTSSSELLALCPDGFLLSNGPGDPETLVSLFPVIRELAAAVPTFGICLGHQLIALAFGARTYKLKFGHRGQNHPVLDLTRNHIAVTSQNHGYAVCEHSLSGTDLIVTHRNHNDGTIEGIKHSYLPLSGVQFHPEGSPGPHDYTHLFDQFIAQVTAQ